MDGDKQPQPTGETVDTWEMVVVHKMFKREFAEMPGLIRAVAAGDSARAQLVAAHVEMMTGLLHHHHTGEDEMLWPRLLDRIGNLDTDLVHRMEKQHEVVGEALERVGKLLPRWRSHADASTRDELADVLAGMSGPLNEHLGEEEREILPLVSIYVTAAEWKALGDHGKASIPKGAKGFDVIGMVMQDATPRERVRFLGLLPPPVRLIYKLVGGGIHRRAKARRETGLVPS
jgi:hemerythrin-like domain-containing protein